MGVFRKVSATNEAEATEVQVSGAVLNPDGSYGITLGDISSWPDQVDFITYARDIEGSVDEDSRVVWTGKKDDDSSVTATRTGGREAYVPDATNVAAVVPTHRWANDIIKGLKACLPEDGENGVKDNQGNTLILSVGSVQPSPVDGKTILWFKPLE